MQHSHGATVGGAMRNRTSRTAPPRTADGKSQTADRKDGRPDRKNGQGDRKDGQGDKVRFTV